MTASVILKLPFYFVILGKQSFKRRMKCRNLNPPGNAFLKTASRYTIKSCLISLQLKPLSPCLYDIYEQKPSFWKHYWKGCQPVHTKVKTDIFNNNNNNYGIIFPSQLPSAVREKEIQARQVFYSSSSSSWLYLPYTGKKTIKLILVDWLFPPLQTFFGKHVIQCSEIPLRSKKRPQLYSRNTKERNSFSAIDGCKNKRWYFSVSTHSNFFTYILPVWYSELVGGIMIP